MRESGDRKEERNTILLKLRLWTISALFKKELNLNIKH